MKLITTLKKITLIAMVIIISHCSALAWGNDVAVAFHSGTQNNFTQTHMAIAENGWIYQVCFNSNSHAIEIYKSTDAGVSFTSFKSVPYTATTSVASLDLTVGMINSTEPKVILATAIYDLSTQYSGVWVDMWEDDGASIPHTFKNLYSKSGTTSQGLNYIGNSFTSVSVATDTKAVPSGISPFSIVVATTLRNTQRDSVYSTVSTNGGVNWLNSSQINVANAFLSDIDVTFVPTNTANTFGAFAFCYLQSNSNFSIGKGDIHFDTYNYDNSHIYGHNGQIINSGNSTYAYSAHPKIHANTFGSPSLANPGACLAVVYDYYPSATPTSVSQGISYVTTSDYSSLPNLTWTTSNFSSYAISANGGHPDVRINSYYTTFPIPAANHLFFDIVYQYGVKIYTVREEATNNISWHPLIVSDDSAVSDTTLMNPSIDYDPLHTSKPCIAWSSGFSGGITIITKQSYSLFDREAIVTGMENVAGNTILKFYPNPAANQITVAVEPDMVGGTITITDLSGAVVASDAIVSERQLISVSDLAKGMYLVSVAANGKTGIQKLIIQ